MPTNAARPEQAVRMMGVVSVQQASQFEPQPERTQLLAWARHAINRPEAGEAGGMAASDREITLRIVDKTECAALNAQYRQMARPTNVLSFPASLPDAHVLQALAQDAANAFHWPLGDVVLCAPVIHQEAIDQRKQPAAHWAHMVIHGVLHLQGFDHIEAADAAEMEALEIALLQSLGYPDPYTDHG